MENNPNVGIVRSGYEAFGRGDIAALLNLFDENIMWVTPGPSALPTSGRRRGRQEVAGFFQTLNDTFQIEQFTPRQFIGDGNTVVVTGDEVARARTTNRSFNVEWCHVFEMKDGLVTAFHEYFDASAALEALRERAAAAGA